MKYMNGLVIQYLSKNQRRLIGSFEILYFRGKVKSAQ